MKKIFLHSAFIVAVMVLAAACSGGRKSADRTAEAREPERRSFAPVRIPAAITDPEAGREYLREHFWDEVDFADTLCFAGLDTGEMVRIFALYVSLLDPDDGSQVETLMKRAAESKYALDWFAFLADRVLWDPNSPWRSDELYIPVLEAQTASRLTDRYEKIAAEARLKIALQNRPGHEANDFHYTAADGRSARMHSLATDYVLLYFNNPGCAMCRSVTEALSASPLLGAMIDEGRLTVLAVYPDDDLAAWRESLDEIPSEWIAAYDAEGALESRQLYDLKAIPSLYLLDSSKRVLVKDSSEPAFIEAVIAAREGL